MTHLENSLTLYKNPMNILLPYHTLSLLNPSTTKEPYGILIILLMMQMYKKNALEVKYICRCMMQENTSEVNIYKNSIHS